MDHVFRDVDYVSASSADWDCFNLCWLCRRADPALDEAVIVLVRWIVVRVFYGYLSHHFFICFFYWSEF